MGRERHTVYQRLYMAAKQGRGLRLSPQEAFDLGQMDDAITTRAIVDWDEQGFDTDTDYPFSRKKPATQPERDGRGNG